MISEPKPRSRGGPQRPPAALRRSRRPAGEARPDAPAGQARWRPPLGAALAAGHLDRILDEAERAGLKATLERASSEDLLALADAARYRRRMDLAREALLAERRRFPDSPRALDAAFLLGTRGGSERPWVGASHRMVR